MKLLKPIDETNSLAKCLQLYRSWFQRVEKISRLNPSFSPLLLLLPFHRENKLLKGFSRWKIVRINLLMADSLEGINRLRKSCSAHAKNCGRISEIVSWLAPRARELSIPFCSGARTKWREHESSRVKRLGRSSYANPRCLNMKFSTWNPCIGFHLLFQITC